MAKRILVVDDELDMRTFISTLLKSNGYTVFVAENGRAGLEMYNEKQPDLVTMDVMMPQESGITLYREIKTRPGAASTPVVVVSGLAKKTFMHSQKMMDKFKNQRVPEPEGYIEKPPEPEELLDAVGRLLA